jgi:hypothetical protein
MPHLGNRRDPGEADRGSGRNLSSSDIRRWGIFLRRRSEPSCSTDWVRVNVRPSTKSLWRCVPGWRYSISRMTFYCRSGAETSRISSGNRCVVRLAQRQIAPPGPPVTADTSGQSDRESHRGRTVHGADSYWRCGPASRACAEAPCVRRGLLSRRKVRVHPVKFCVRLFALSPFHAQRG